LWVECRGRAGLHTAPSAEAIELIDGEVVWTALNWSGTVFVRLRTGVVADLVQGRCRGCDRPGSRLLLDAAPPFDLEEMPLQDEVALPRDEPVPAEPVRSEPVPVRNGAAPFVQVLDAHPGVAAWQAELRTVNGQEELLVFFSPGTEDPVAVLRDIAGDLRATQFVVLTEAELLDRLARHDEQRVVDRR
jgi:hypothetical protein